MVRIVRSILRVLRTRPSGFARSNRAPSTKKLIGYISTVQNNRLMFTNKRAIDPVSITGTRITGVFQHHQKGT